MVGTIVPTMGISKKNFLAAPDAGSVRTTFVRENRTEALQQWRETVDKLRAHFAKVPYRMEHVEQEVLALKRFPKEHCPHLASTNSLDRLTKEIKRPARE